MDWLFSFRRRRAANVGVAEQPNVHPEYAQAANDGGYIFGEGESEISRLNFQHYMFRYALGADFAAPIQAPRDVLDVACGTGRWAREVARRFPDANVIGFDINRDQLDASLAEGTDALPDNCTFVFGDALQRFQFYDGTFDFTMARACSAFVPVAKWPSMVNEMARVTRTGGWVELRDFGLVRSKNPALNELTVKFANLANARGIHPGAGSFLPQYLVAAGLRDVHVQRIAVRSGLRRGTRAGQFMLVDYLALLERVTPMVAQGGIDTAEHWTSLVWQAREETRMAPDEHYAEVELTAAWGQR